MKITLLFSIRIIWKKINVEMGKKQPCVALLVIISDESNQIESLVIIDWMWFDDEIPNLWFDLIRT